MKGQWFIISAVIASSIFLGISFLLKDYFVIDSASTARISNDFYFSNIEEQLNNIVAKTITTGGCINLTTALNEFITVAEKDLSSKGLFSKMEYNIVQCDPNVVKFDFIVASHDEIIYKFSTRQNVSELIG